MLHQSHVVRNGHRLASKWDAAVTDQAMRFFLTRIYLKTVRFYLRLKLAWMGKARRCIASYVSKQMAPFMVAGLLVHEENTWLTIRLHSNQKSFQVSLAELRRVPCMVWGDGEGTVIAVEIKTSACTDPNGVTPAEALSCGN
jgi:hypothetical protein